MDVKDHRAFDSWLEAYGRAWENKDPGPGITPS
jgi:hypothetical protein